MIKKFLLTILLFPSLLFCIDWTVMVYMCADNSMHEQSYVDIDEMTQIGSSDKVKIIIQVDNIASSSEPGCRRYLINQNNRELITNLGEIDMANPQTLIDFVRFTQARFTAKNYLLILWDHGNGWPIGSYSAYKNKAIIYDQSSNNWIGIADGELKFALNEIKNRLGKKVSLLCFDACLMAMAEVADEIADGADIMLAAQDQNPWDGLPYHDIFSYLTNNPSISPQNYARQIVNLWIASYNNGSQGYETCTFSAVDLSKFRQARDKFSQTCHLLIENAYTQAMRDARNQTQTFSIEHIPPMPSDDYIDLIDFLDQSLTAITSPAHKINIEKTIQDFQSAVIQSQQNGSYLDKAKGISVWFPDNYLTLKNNYLEYQNLTWSKQINWLKFLNNYFSTDDIKPTPVLVSSSPVGNKNNFRLSWSNSYDLARVNYNIIEVQNLEQIFSDSGNDFANWINNGFKTITDTFHSAAKAFYSDSGNAIEHTLNLTYPVSLPSGSLLSFWSFYETEDIYGTNETPKRDVFYVEYAQVDRNYIIIDSFYGSSRIWTEHRYLLPPQDNFFLRFRYLTDATISRLGVYLDDITITAFDNVRDIGVNLIDTCFAFFNLGQNTYHYLVTPVDSFGNIGFTSEFGTVNIQSYCEPYSMPSPFFTDCRIICDYPSVGPPEYFLRLFIYTLNGELVKQFDDTYFNQNTVYWDGRNQAGQEVASGLYIVVLTAGNFTRIGKIAKVK
jgi:hypothetical protein